MKQKSLNGFWESVDPDTKKGVVIAAGTVLVGSVAGYIAYKKYKKYKADKILRDAMTDGTLASIVEKINIGIDGLGTDTEKVYEAFSDIPFQAAARKVAKLYDTAYGETLDEAMRGDLDTDEMQTCKNILAGKPNTRFDKPNYKLLGDWVRRLSLAKGTFSTDEDAIYRVLWEVPDRKGYALLSKAIAANKEQTGYESLTDYLSGELDASERNHAGEIMQRKPNYNEKSAES